MGLLQTPQCGGFGGGLFSFFDHGLDLCEFNSLHKVFKFRDARSHERRLGLVPIDDRLLKQFADLLGESRQNGREVNNDLSE